LILIILQNITKKSPEDEMIEKKYTAEAIG
jgi:hypothetical protein